MAKLKCSTSCLHIFSTFSSNFLQIFQMTKLDCFHHRSTNVCKNTVKVKAAFCSNEFLLCQKCVIFWLHGVRMNFSAICRLPLSLGYGHLKAQKTKCHNKTCAFEQQRSIPTQTTGETVKRSYLLVLHQGLKQFHSKRATD